MIVLSAYIDWNIFRNYFYLCACLYDADWMRGVKMILMLF